jgi:methylglutaconyl-CoA hydratase
MEFVTTEVADGIMTITLVDVEGRNTLSRQLLEELTTALDTVDRDPDIRVAVLTNQGRVFCAGANLAERSSNDAGRNDKGSIGMSTVLQRIQNSPKPFVGRIDGHCVAGGVGLAAVMDISIAVDTALFGFTEVRVGVVPATISVVCLPKMSRADAQSAFLRGNRFPAIEAARMGLINKAVSPEMLDQEIREVVNDLLAGEPHAIEVAKRLVTQASSISNEEAFARMTQLSDELFASEGAHEGMTAYLEKRTASWVRTLTSNDERSRT